MRANKSHIRDFTAYLKWYRLTRKSKFCPFDLPVLTEGSYNSLAAFSRWESNGKMLACKHLRTLKAVLIGKQYLNFCIKLWSEGLAEVPLFEIQHNFSFLPDWVWDAVLKQSRKYKERDIKNYYADLELANMNKEAHISVFIKKFNSNFNINN